MLWEGPQLSRGGESWAAWFPFMGACHKPAGPLLTHAAHTQAMCFIRPTRENIKLLTAELKAPRFQAYYICGLRRMQGRLAATHMHGGRPREDPAWHAWVARMEHSSWASFSH